MKPLVTNQRVLSWLCVCPVDKNTNKWQKLVYKIFTISLAILMMGIFVSSSMFFWKFMAVDVEEALYAVYQVMGSTCLLYIMFIVVCFSRSKLNVTFSKLSDIYKASKKFLDLKCLTLQELFFGRRSILRQKRSRAPGHFIFYVKSRRWRPSLFNKKKAPPNTPA